MLDSLHALNVALFKLVHQGLWGTVWLHVLEVVQYAGHGLGLAVMVGAALALAPRARWLELLVRTLVPVGVAAGCSEVLKQLVHAERPATLFPALVLSTDPKLPRHFSWPSGHTTAAFAFAVALVFLSAREGIPTRRWKLTAAIVFTIAVLTALGRVALAAHFPGDVLAGALVGSTASLATCRVLERLHALWLARPGKLTPVVVEEVR
jgi:membrane-associated phospholipid phosphatase